MGGLIWIIVIVVVISEIKKLQGKSGQRVKPNVPRQQQYMRPDQTKVGQQNVRSNQMPRPAAERAPEPDAAPAAGHAPEPDGGAAECAPEPDGRTAECAPEPDAGTADAECRRGCHGRLPQTAA